MDYQRIYREFIADRKALNVSGYSEKHHILPRALGGSDAVANLVALTPEDHFFAHLLLAKMFGGKMASALQLLAHTVGQRWSRRMCGRRAYGLGQRIAARLKAAAWSGVGNPLFNDTVHNWTNYRTGEARSATIYAMDREFGGSRPHWTNVARGNRPSYRGWLLTSNSNLHARSEKGQAATFVQRDGRVFVGTQGAFVSRFGLNPAAASRVVRHQAVTRCGWRLLGVPDRPANWAKDGLPSRQRRLVEPNAT